MNCPFYGRAFFSTSAQAVIPRQPPFLLFNSQGNQCALVIASHSPCRMEIDGEEPDWKTCVLVKAVRCEEVA